MQETRYRKADDVLRRFGRGRQVEVTGPSQCYVSGAGEGEPRQTKAMLSVAAEATAAK